MSSITHEKKVAGINASEKLSPSAALLMESAREKLREFKDFSSIKKNKTADSHPKLSSPYQSKAAASSPSSVKLKQRPVVSPPSKSSTPKSILRKPKKEVDLKKTSTPENKKKSPKNKKGSKKNGSPVVERPDWLSKAKGPVQNAIEVSSKVLQNFKKENEKSHNLDLGDNFLWPEHVVDHKILLKTNFKENQDIGDLEKFLDQSEKKRSEILAANSLKKQTVSSAANIIEVSVGKSLPKNSSAAEKGDLRNLTADDVASAGNLFYNLRKSTSGLKFTNFNSDDSSGDEMSTLNQEEGNLEKLKYFCVYLLYEIVYYAPENKYKKLVKI